MVSAKSRWPPTGQDVRIGFFIQRMRRKQTKWCIYVQRTKALRGNSLHPNNQTCSQNRCQEQHKSKRTREFYPNESQGLYHTPLRIAGRKHGGVISASSQNNLNTAVQRFLIGSMPIWPTILVVASISSTVSCGAGSSGEIFPRSVLFSFLPYPYPHGSLPF